MNVDLYGAWLTAGNNLQPLGDWIGAHWIGLAAAITAITLAWLALRRASRQVGQILRDENTAADYSDAGFQRLRNAINQPRKEKP